MTNLTRYSEKEDDISMSVQKVLEIQNLTVNYPINGGNLTAVNNISLSLNSGEILGLVGESGCGKSTLGFAILRLLKGGNITKGSIVFKGKNLIEMTDDEIYRIRGPKISMIFQASQDALNPLQKVSAHFIDTLKCHNKWNEDAFNKILKLTNKLEIPESRLEDYPHQFSGGMQQRIVIALTLILKPELIIADEPTTALDVLVQARILTILKKLIEDLNLTVIYITHDLGVISSIANRVAIMYAGEIVEISDTSTIFKNPAHPYTKALIASIPDVKDKTRQKLAFIPGKPPDMSNLPQGCSFFERCSYAIPLCAKIKPEEVYLSSMNISGHSIKCLMYEEKYRHQFKRKGD